ncbi:Uncharacterised protein [Mycobacteroides abscessus subsp. abscessus]|nr:Uncharacterised protein [Mycobacteroides abscessus subsp. abscessus]
MVATGTEIHYDFPGIEAHLDRMDALKVQLTAKKEILQNELTRWTGFWDGVTKENAIQFTTTVITTLENTLQALTAYILKARYANQDMHAQELANAATF